ncbi:MAG: OprD family outer membrane porin, partial [Pseudomonas sp.]
GADAFGYLGVKLDSGRGRSGTGLLPVDSDDRAADSYSKAGAALKLRLADSVLKIGEMSVETPVFATTDDRLLPETASGFLLTSKDIDDLEVNAGHFTDFRNKDSSNRHDEFYGYGADTSGGGIGFVGGRYAVSDELSASLYGSELQDTWRQYYGNLAWGAELAPEQRLALDFNLYRTLDHGKALAGEIANTSYSLAATYSLGIHALTLAYQRIDGDTPFDYVGGDSIMLANSMQYSDFNAPHERSWQLRYELDLADWLPGLSLMTAYTRGSQIDGSHAAEGGAYNPLDDDSGEFEPLYGDGGKHWERNIAINYEVADGAAKGLSLSLLQSTHRANSAQGEGSQDELQLIVQYPLHLL